MNNNGKQQTKSRRQFVRNVLAGSMGLATLPSLLAAGPLNGMKKKKVVCLGGHPDDPESGCGGTLAKFAAAGHDVTVIYLTTGEAGIAGKSHTEAAAIRKQEAENACRVLQAKPLFAGQIDGDTVLNNEWVAKMRTFFEDEKPDLVFTHWPLDSHKDHQVAGLLAIQAWMHMEHRFPLYFFEVCIGMQTMGFHPTDYVDISDTREKKREAIYCHTSQDPPGIYGCGHASMEEFRGRELGVQAAEAFIRMNGKTMGGISIDA
ncbi:MAG: PIG-L family deacetylase [Puia sp.]|nr:PIG-L family deacetylase [Puia sp.]